MLTGAAGLTAPALSSNPTAAAKLYLNFVGAPASDWFGTPVPETLAYDQDGNPSAFTSGELTSMAQIWARVVEKFSPFNLDVTTVAPSSLSDRQGVEIVIGGSDWLDLGRTGTAYVGSFSNYLPNRAYVFAAAIKGDQKSDPKNTAEIIAHEAGHTFGLNHQSRYAGGYLEYNPGNGATAPVMGTSLSAIRGQWWNGPSFSQNSIQDDLSILSGSGNGFGYRADDHGNTAATADALTITGNTISGGGIIETSGDVDCFRFVSGPGVVSLAVDVALLGPMLDAKVELRDSAGRVLAAADTASLGETLSASVSGGAYYLYVAGHGGYGDIGQYRISGALPSAVVGGSAGDDDYLVQQTSGTIQVFNGVTPTGTPVYTMPASSPLSLVFGGTGGNDRLKLDVRGGEPIPAGGLFFYGGGGVNSLQVMVDSLTPPMKLGQNQFTFATSRPITFDQVAQLVVDADGNPPPAVGSSDGLNLVAGDSARISLDTLVDLASLTINSGANIDLPGGSSAVLRTASLTINGGGILDLAAGTLVIQSDALRQAGVITDLTPLLHNGRNGGGWNGPGIISSTAAGDSSHHTGLAMVINQTGTGGLLMDKVGAVTVDANCILIKSASNGDTDLNGTVNADDYFRIDRGFLTHGGSYAQGDLDYSGVLNADDYFLIDSVSISQTLTAGLKASQSSPHPSPLAMPPRIKTTVPTPVPSNPGSQAKVAKIAPVHPLPQQVGVPQKPGDDACNSAASALTGGFQYRSIPPESVPTALAQILGTPQQVVIDQSPAPPLRAQPWFLVQMQYRVRSVVFTYSPAALPPSTALPVAAGHREP